jgi:outer membrane protein OmpA-like peptidoglycan-associated protein
LKMKTLKIFTLVSIACFFNISFAQQELSPNKLQRMAKKYAANAEYQAAREMLHEALKISPDRFNLNYELGLSYYYNSPHKELAIPYFEKALQLTLKDTVSEIFYYLGDLYQHKGKLDIAKDYYTRMKSFVTNNKNGAELLADLNNKISQCLSGNAFAVAVDKKIKIENLGSNVNSGYSDYAPVLAENGEIILFTSRRPSESGKSKRDDDDDKFYEDMYISKKTEDGGFGPAVLFQMTDKYFGMVPNSPGHDAIVSISADEKKLFTFNNNSIWISELTPDGNWNGPTKIDQTINAKRSYQPHASLSTDGKTIYFSSNRKGGTGGLDLYRSELNADGNWGPAINLGSEINSKFDEDSPFISEDGTRLYFSSKGHDTFGGYDIFYAELINGKLSKPVNLGWPINSPADDIFYQPTKDGKNGYFSSSRTEGLGEMDIYKLTFITKPEFKNCIALNTASNSPVDFVIPDTVLLNHELVFSATQNEIPNSIVDNVYWNFGGDEYFEGTATRKFEAEGSYEVKMELHAYHKEKFTVNDYCVSRFFSVVRDLPITPVLAVNSHSENSSDIKGTDDLKRIAKDLKNGKKVLADEKVVKSDVNPEFSSVKFETVYHEFNSSRIEADAIAQLDRNIEILKSNPNLKIKIVAHTDARGAADFNLRLSERRAKAAADYLISKGISSKRIKSIIGSGEQQILNKCLDSVDCPDEDHAVNRRTEFIIAE